MNGMNDIELTTKQKWAEVDSMLNSIKARKAKGEQLYPLEQYVYDNFSKS